MPNPKSTSQLIRTTATVSIQAAADGRGDRQQPRISILAYGGGVMDVPGFGPVVIDLAGLELPEQIPLLADHDNTLHGILGHGEPLVKSGKLHIDGRIASTDAANQALQLASDGLVLRASVGVRPISTRHVREGERVTLNYRTITAKQRFLLAEKSALAEVSIVAVGADPNTTVSIAARAGSRGTNPMPDSPPAGTNTDPPNDQLADERQRTAGILRVARDAPEICARAIDEGWDIQRTELEVLRASRPSLPYRHGVGSSSPDAAPAYTGGHALPGGAPTHLIACAALMHAGSYATAEKSFGAHACDQAATLRVTSTLDLCRASLMLAGREVPTDRGKMIRAAFSTSTLSGALAAATQREAMTAFTEAPAAWRMIAKTRSSPDFREHEGLRPYFKGGRLEKIGKDGEIKHAATDQDKYPFQVHTFARMFAVDRHTIVNDDISAVFELLRELGRQAARTIADEVAALILANPDSFFHSDNGNLLTGTESALGIDALSAAVQALREQKDSDGKPIDVSPKTLLVAPAGEAIGRQLLNSTGVLIDGNDSPVQSPGGNPWRGLAQLAVDSRFASEPDAWYLFADPMNVPAIVVSFLNGVEAPVVEQDETQFNTLGRQFRVYIDFGVNAADPRGAVKNTGEA